MGNPIIVIAFFLFSTLGSMAQTARVFQDSINVVVNNITSDSLKAIEYYDAAVYALQPLNDLKLSRSYVDSSMHYSRKANVKDSEARCYFLLGIIERLEGNYVPALEHLNKNIQHFENDSTNMAYALFQVGTIHDLRGDYESSLKVFFEILKIFEHKKDSFAMASTYNSIAVVYKSMKKIDNSLVSLKSAVNIFEKLDAKRDVANTYRNIGEIYLQKSDTVKGIEFIQKSLKIATEIDEKYAIGYSLYELGRAYIKSQPKKAYQYFLDAKKIMEEGNYKSILIKINTNLGGYFHNLKEYPNAILYYNKALVLAAELEELPPQEKIFKSLSDIYTQLSNFQKANEYLSKYTVVKDSIYTLESLKTINLLEIKYESEKKQNEILSLSEENLQKETMIVRKNSWIRMLSLGVVTLVILATSFFVIYRQKLRVGKQNAVFEAMAQAEFKERHRIARDLHDSIGAMLAVVKNQLSGVTSENKEQFQQIEKSQQLLASTADETRRIAHNMMPEELTKFGLVNALESLLQSISSEEKVKTNLVHFGLEEQLNPVKELHIYRIVQELFQNIQKHAKAKKATLQLTKHSNRLNLIVEDDGVGFEVNNDLIDGFGLKNIISRVNFLRGTMQIDSSIGIGTSVIINIPIG